MKTMWAVCVALLAGSMAAADQPSFPKPGPEHGVLKAMEGTWDAVMKTKAPGQPATEAKGTMVWKMELGGLWLIGDYKGSFADMPFSGKSLDSYDATKKKYVGLWVDSFTTTPMASEGTYDAAKKTMTMTSDFPGPDGKVVKHTLVSTFKDNDTIIFTMAMPGKDGKDEVMMTITYTRKK